MIYVGITGFRTKEDAIEILKYCDSKETYMFGYLVSEKSLRFEDMGNFRYPTFKSFGEFKELLDFDTKDKNIIKMIHFNSSKEDFHLRLIPFLKEVKPNALQLNLNFIPFESIRTIRKECPDIDLLFVYNKSIEKKYSIEEIQKVLKDFKYILFDFSGGNGVQISKKLINKAKNFKDISIGYAGGLSGDNVKEFLETNEGEYFIDAENKLLRNETLDYEACEKYIKNATRESKKAKTVEIKINVLKNCGTCKHICFLENLSLDVPEIAECEIFNKIVAKEDKEKGIEYDDTECKEWVFDYSLLDDCSSFIDLETDCNKEVFEENKSGKKLVYSLDNERYVEDLEFIAEKLKANEEKFKKVYVGTQIVLYHKDFVKDIDFLDDINAVAYQNFDELAVGYLMEATKEKKEELKELVVDWLDNNLAQPYFFEVENIKEILKEEFFEKHYAKN